MFNYARSLAFYGLLAFGIASAPMAHAQFPSGRQTTPDGKQVLVNRSQGGLQWAISYSPNDGTITGNVFDPGGGDPSYIWCERVGDDGVMDPSAVQIDWRCEGGSPCEQSPCLASNWTDLGVVPLGGFFFLPARDPFVTLQLPEAYCDPIILGFVNEFAGSPSWEVDTVLCPYASMTQPSLTPVEANEDIWVRVWNYALEEPRDGTGYFTLMLGDQVIYNEEMPIPKQSGLLGPFGVPEGEVGICLRPNISAPAGTPVSWNIQLREPEVATQNASSRSDSGSDGSSDLAGPLHSTPGVVHMIEITVGSNCLGEPAGRRLTTNDAWTHVSPGLPTLP